VPATLKPVRWVGTSLKDLRSFPPPARSDVGQALFTAQQGQMDPAAKPLKGFGGASVLEIVAAHRRDAWRVVYTVRFPDAIYVLHAFQKKSTKGISTPARDLDLIRRRLVDAERDHRERRQSDEIEG
jgi:phage-related protein